MKQGKRS